MHLLARNFASQLEAEVKANEESEIFGAAFRYRKIFHGETEDKEYVTVEEFIPGQFKKYINNTGQTCVDPTHIMAQKAECFLPTSPMKDQRRNLCWLTSRDLDMTYLIRKLLLQIYWMRMTNNTCIVLEIFHN